MVGNTVPKVLLINLDDDILDTLIKGLQSEASITFTSTGSETFEMVRLHKPDLILLDLKKSDLNGFEICQALKADPESQSIPVVFLTRIGGAKNIARAFELGAIEYITEPLDHDAVNLKIQGLLAQIAASRPSEAPEEIIPSVEENRSEQRLEQHPEQHPEQQPQHRRKGMSTAKFVIIALLLVLIEGGGYVWYTNDLPEDRIDIGSFLDAVLNTVLQTGPTGQTSAPDEEELVEEIKEEPLKEPQSAGIKELSAPAENPAPEPVVSTETCGEIPKVPWWSGATHESIIAYVNSKHDGDWDAYILKWENQLLNLQGVYSRGGTVVTPIQRSQLSGAALADYISQFERRLDVARCLADRVSSR